MDIKKIAGEFSDAVESLPEVASYIIGDTLRGVSVKALLTNPILTDEQKLTIGEWFGNQASLHERLQSKLNGLRENSNLDEESQSLLSDALSMVEEAQNCLKPEGSDSAASENPSPEVLEI